MTFGRRQTFYHIGMFSFKMHIFVYNNAKHINWDTKLFFLSRWVNSVV
jgi:hypothetical protein